MSELRVVPPHPVWLYEHGISVVDNPALADALDAWTAMRDQRDQARAIAVQLEQENAVLRRKYAELYRAFLPERSGVIAWEQLPW